MPQTIFFSWQLDTVPLVGRNLIERGLKLALARIEADTELKKAAREFEVDRDTQGVAGTPPIVDTIFKKIDAAAVFLPELAFVGTRIDGGPAPNPNVLIEYGWALKSHTQPNDAGDEHGLRQAYCRKHAVRHAALTEPDPLSLSFRRKRGRAAPSTRKPRGRSREGHSSRTSQPRVGS